MTVTRTLARRLAVAALLLCALAAAGIALLVTIATPEPAQVAQAPAPAVVEPIAPAPVAPVTDPLLVALMPGSEVTPAHAEQLNLVADRVCEGWVAEVPLVYVRDGVAAELSISDEDARAFVDLVIETRCPDPGTLSAPLPAAEVVAGPITPAPAPQAHIEAQAPAEAPAVAPAPAPVEPEVTEQLADEAIGGARCDDPAQVIVAQADGALVCGQA
jgi:hypothetical protein